MIIIMISLYNKYLYYLLSSLSSTQCNHPYCLTLISENVNSWLFADRKTSRLHLFDSFERCVGELLEIWWVVETNHNMRTLLAGHEDDRICQYASSPAMNLLVYQKSQRSWATNDFDIIRPPSIISNQKKSHMQIYHLFDDPELLILSLSLARALNNWAQDPTADFSYVFNCSTSRTFEWKLYLCGWTGSSGLQYWYVSGSVDGLEATLHSNTKYDLASPTSQLCSWGGSLHTLSWLEGVRAAPGFAHLRGSPFATQCLGYLTIG